MRLILALLAFGAMFFAGRRLVLAGEPVAQLRRVGATLLPAAVVTTGGGAFTPAKARAIVERLNRTKFGGWFQTADVMAVIDIESNFKPGAMRFEPKLGESSTGLMQLLLSTARDRGFTGPEAGLKDPETNIRLGMAHLKWSRDFLATRDPDITTDQWIGSYNAGVGNALKGFIPIEYVRRWRAARKRHGG